MRKTKTYTIKVGGRSTLFFLLLTIHILTERKITRANIILFFSEIKQVKKNSILEVILKMHSFS